MALRLTSARGANTAVVRNYQRPPFSGPQSIVQRDRIEILELEPRIRRSGVINPGGTRGFDEVQCHICDKWRRVDEETLRLFQNRIWWCDRYEHRRQALLISAPHLIGAMEAWLPQVHAQQTHSDAAMEQRYLHLADAEDFLQRRGFNGIVWPEHARAWYELLEALCWEYEVTMGEKT